LTSGTHPGSQFICLRQAVACARRQIARLRHDAYSRLATAANTFGRRVGWLAVKPALSGCRKISDRRGVVTVCAERDPVSAARHIVKRPGITGLEVVWMYRLRMRSASFAAAVSSTTDMNSQSFLERFAHTFSRHAAWNNSLSSDRALHIKSDCQFTRP
jgi:hypothetical protein